MVHRNVHKNVHKRGSRRVASSRRVSYQIELYSLLNLLVMAKLGTYGRVNTRRYALVKMVGLVRFELTIACHALGKAVLPM